MNFSTTDHSPDDPENLPPARRRRARRSLVHLNADERVAFLDKLARRLSPSFDFFLFSLLSGIVLSVGLVIDAPSLLVLGAVLAPTLTPAIGLSLGTVIGSSHQFLRSLAGLLIGCLLVFLAGWITGALALSQPSQDLSQAYIHTQLSWLNFLVLAAGAILATVYIVDIEHERAQTRAAVMSVALAYSLYLPLSTAGLGLGARLPYLWPDGLVVFLLHLTGSVLLGALILAIMGFRPLTLFGYSLSGAIALLGVVVIIGISSAGAVISAHLGLPTPVPSPTPTLTPSPTLTSTPIPPTPTYTPSPTLTPTVTPTITPTPTATPILALVQSNTEGARIRSEPGGETVGFLANGTMVILQPETDEQDGVVWVRITLPDGTQGWIVQSLVFNITPTPSQTP